jgi:hypothetical protein
MRWTITIEGTDEFGAAHRSDIALEKDLNSLTAGAVGCSIEDGKAIMAQLQQVIVKQQCETYVRSRRFCMDCERFDQNGVWLRRSPQPAHLELPALLTAFL